MGLQPLKITVVVRLNDICRWTAADRGAEVFRGCNIMMAIYPPRRPVYHLSAPTMSEMTELGLAHVSCTATSA
jgi:hypothetical protein